MGVGFGDLNTQFLLSQDLQPLLIQCPCLRGQFSLGLATGQPEVQKLHLLRAALAHQPDARRRHVEMDDALGMHRRQPLQQSVTNLRSLIFCNLKRGSKTSSSKPLLQRLTSQELHECEHRFAVLDTREMDHFLRCRVVRHKVLNRRLCQEPEVVDMVCLVQRRLENNRPGQVLVTASQSQLGPPARREPRDKIPASNHQPLAALLQLFNIPALVELVDGGSKGIKPFHCPGRE
mmetsp:Transcript_51038/g.134472  ORF Transcript_51038/g.134472 Transcript_51038/m.134472 type:complete len:234 (+) Transcript_51038:169-870(+)